MPIGSSYTPGFTTWPDTQTMRGPPDLAPPPPPHPTRPDTQTMRVPPDLPMPTPANHSPPLVTMSGRFMIVSTLLTTVGALNRPFTAGNGGFSRGQPRLPSSELSSPVSSPQMYAPAPRCRVTSSLNEPAAVT